MSYETVRIDREGAIATVTFDRKGSLNAFTQQMILELTDAARSFRDDTKTQAVVFTGTPDAFSAGIDRKELAGDGFDKMDDVERRQAFYRGVRLCEAVEEMPQITIAAMERMAVGAGIALGLACDWRVLGREAFLYVPEVKIGLNLQWGALPRLISLVGPARAKRICILCERMGADQALDWGIVDEVADDGKTVAAALALAARAVEMPWATARMVKEAVNATAGALHKASAFADADQSQLTRLFDASQSAARAFVNRPE